MTMNNKNNDVTKYCCEIEKQNELDKRKITELTVAELKHIIAYEIYQFEIRQMQPPNCSIFPYSGAKFDTAEIEKRLNLKRSIFLMSNSLNKK